MLRLTFARYLSMLMTLQVFVLACGARPQGSTSASPEEAAPAPHRVHLYISPRHEESGSSEVFSLAAHHEILEISFLGSSQLASWILYDSRLMPRLHSIEAQSLLQDWLDTSGDFIAASENDEWLSQGSRDLDARHRVYSYQRYVQGVAVRDNILQLILARVNDGWHLKEVVSNATGALHRAVVEPALGEKELLALDDLRDYQLQSQKLEWIALHADEGFSHELATVFTLRDAEDNDFVASILHSDRRLLEHYPLALHINPKSVQARALKRSYLDAGPREYPLAFAQVTNGADKLALGAEAWLPEETSPQVVTLSGPRAVLSDADGSTPQYTRLQNQNDAFVLNNQSYDFAAVNSFVAVQRINRFVRQFVGSSELPFLDSPVKVVANSADGACNAYYSPRLERILLYREGKDCANMALINDVIFHEWGHALDDHSGLSEGIVDYAFSEGIADTLAAYYNNDPDIAPGFFFNDATPVRSVLNNRQYPKDQSSTTHFEGGIISGAFWDMRVSLIERYGKRRGAYYAAYLFMRHLLSVDSYTDSYAAVLRLDDDDGKAETPSPNRCLIQKAFARHGLAPDSGCEDAVAMVEESAVDEDLTLTLWELGQPEDGVRLFASSQSAAGLVYCWNDRGPCLRDSNQRQVLAPLSASRPAQRRFFGSEPLQLPSDRQTLTLLRLDQRGEVVGSRSFVIHNK